MGNDWWKEYCYRGDTTYLSKYSSVEEFEATVPAELKLKLNKLTLAECCIWSKYNDKHGAWPTVKQCMFARQIKASSYFVFERMMEHFNEEV